MRLGQLKASVRLGQWQIIRAELTTSSQVVRTGDLSLLNASHHSGVQGTSDRWPQGDLPVPPAAAGCRLSAPASYKISESRPEAFTGIRAVAQEVAERVAESPAGTASALEEPDHRFTAEELRWTIGSGSNAEARMSSFKSEVAASVNEAAEAARVMSGGNAALSTPPGAIDSKHSQVERLLRRKLERRTYLLAAIASSVGFLALAGGAVLYRFISQMQAGGQVPYKEIFGTFALAIGAAVGMEFWARWAHKALWHASLWNMHESHHRPREGPFELNDVFAIINAVPAIALLAFGFFNRGFVPGLCFGAGLGITLFGMAYMFVHDGLVHRRFPVGPIAEVPYLQRVAAAHQLHHADKFEGVPYGLFLGVEELHRVGGVEDLEALLISRGQARAAAELSLRFKAKQPASE